ncbi:MAG: hypothetical protein A3H70_05065 [Candidatus Komeilibacteria bacterium RIFCSPLOWO2_02_FULL_48_11]|uniref:Bro-N domain-containing protein n=1 Tax=Candidatus Komeilibacteria bacterium RIFCSPLOWO2_02_FULL_48_11 TaxID=1798553 RepID=A0A1G2BPX3_9BACT|nr:MAG: hypothetical protein A3H70_05065 [Candidatus Komeilibacteria bacterium RIFCSPLOWO2_02_FULL_48_11]
MNKEIITTKIAIFQKKEIRKTIHNNEWWFVVEDVVLALIDSANVKDYINKMRRRDTALSEGYGQFVHTLEIPTKGGKQMMNCANTEGIFRIIQSIPSPKAEPFKRWLARVGYERIKEIEDPELAAQAGGSVAGKARADLERKSGKKVSTSKNYLPKIRDRKAIT